MSIAEWIVLALALLPYVIVGFAKARPDLDNRKPRLQLPDTPGWRGRIYAAHLNTFEAFPPFAAGVLIAEWHHASQARIDALALGFLVVRLIYPILYARDLATARSVLWSVGMLLVIALYVTAAA